GRGRCGSARRRPLTDRFGRKSLLIIDAGIYAVGALLSAFAWDEAVLIFARTLIGLAIGADSATAQRPPGRGGGVRGPDGHVAVEPGRAPGPGRGVCVLRVPADHRNQHAALLRPETAGTVPAER